MAHIQSFSQLYSDLALLENALEQLVSAKLVSTLVSMKLMKKAFKMAAAQVASDGRTLCYDTVHQVYAEGDVLFARHRSDLLIRVKLSFTNLPKFTIYQSMTFDLPISGRQGFKTRLEQIPAYFITHRIVFSMGMSNGFCHTPKIVSGTNC